MDEEHIPLRNSPQRARIEVKYIIGENDPGYEKCTENWAATKTQLLNYGHSADKIQMEVIKKGNLDGLGAGHTVYSKRIMDYFIAVEAGYRK